MTCVHVQGYSVQSSGIRARLHDRPTHIKEGEQPPTPHTPTLHHTHTRPHRTLGSWSSLATCVCVPGDLYQPLRVSPLPTTHTHTRPLHTLTGVILDNLVVAYGREVFYRLEVGVSSERPDATPTGIYLQVPGQKEWSDLTLVAGKVGVKMRTPILTFDPIGGRANGRM